MGLFLLLPHLESLPKASLHGQYVDRHFAEEISEGLYAATADHAAVRLYCDSQALSKLHNLLVIDEADVAPPAALYIAHFVKNLQPQTRIILTSATYTANTLNLYGLKPHNLFKASIKRPFEVTTVQMVESSDFLLVLWMYCRVLLQGKFLLQASTKPEVIKLADRLSVSGFSAQPVWAGEQFDPSVQGYAMTELSRGLTLPNLALAVSGTTELYSHDGLLCLGPPSRATVTQRNGRAGRTQPGTAIIICIQE